jgi:hypothetical protein
VKSDFAATTAWNTNAGGGIDGDGKPHAMQNNIPDKFSLEQNYPNPFNPSTEIKYALPNSSYVTIKVYNILGREVAALINHEYKEAGYHNVLFDGTNLASGVYFYKIEAGSYISTKKMVLIK